MKTNPIATLAAGLILFTATAISAAASDKKPLGVTAAEYSVTVTLKDAEVVITAKGASGYHCNMLYPWKLTAADKVYTKKEAEKFAEDGVVFKIPSNKDKKASLKLSVCNDAQCIMETAELTW